MAKVKKQRSPVVRAVRRFFGTFFRIITSVFMVCVITGCVVGCAMTVYILDYIGTIEDIDIRNIEYNQTSIIYANDAEGNPTELARIHGKENRIWVDRDKMPDYLFDVTVAAEDKRFWEHHGVDWMRTAASGVNLFFSIYDVQSGGSTITQQLIKNATDQWDPNVERKIKEIFSALKLENQYDKEDILESYLNVAAFGPNINGVQAAANYYFNKDVSELTLVECAGIVAMTKAPSAYDLIRNPESNAERREYIFRTMRDMDNHYTGAFTQADYEKAVNTKLEVNLSQEAPAQKPNASNSWHTDVVIEEVIADLQETGKTYEEAQALVFRGGLSIYSTVDIEMQNKLEELYIYDGEDDEVFPKIRNAIYPESAFIVLDLHGQIKAVAGSNRPKQGNRVLNYATQVPRQPGSTMKPISAYLQGIDKEIITWSTVLEDSPIELNDNGKISWWPSNYYNSYMGPQTCVFALQKSINTIPVKIMKMLGTETSLYFLHDKCGMKNLVTPEENPETNDNTLSSMAIGGTTKGVTLLELAAAYQIDANGGTFTEPTSYTLVKDSDGNTLLEAKSTPKRVISKETSSILNLMMRQVVDNYPGSGRTAKFTGDLAAMPIAGKTGTSSDNKDQWFVGITPYYIGVTWMGYAPVAQPIDYINFPTPIVWKNVMQPLHEGLEIKDFEYSDQIVQKEYCTISGDLATPDCPSRLSGWYKKTKIPNECTEHSGVQESEEGEVSSREDEDEKDEKKGRSNKDRKEEYDPWGF